jgi:hypothetical protein
MGKWKKKYEYLFFCGKIFFLNFFFFFETVLTFSQRAEKCENAITKRVFQIMEEKQTNLCCSAGDFCSIY